MTTHTIIVLGCSGSGKGTQVVLLAKHLRTHSDVPVVQIEMGAQFREFIAGDSYSSRLSREITDAGKLNPDFLSTWFLARSFIEKVTEGEHIIVDGVPRGVEVAKSLDSGLDFYKRDTPRTVVHIEVSEEWARARLEERNREDDNAAAKIENKFAFYREHVLGTIEYYRQNSKYKVHGVNGEQSVEQVFSEILTSLSI